MRLSEKQLNHVLMSIIAVISELEEIPGDVVSSYIQLAWPKEIDIKQFAELVQQTTENAKAVREGRASNLYTTRLEHTAEYVD